MLTKSLSTVRWIESLRLGLEQVQCFSNVDGGNVHHNVQESDGSTCIGNCLYLLVYVPPKLFENIPGWQTKRG